jgi:hypothetical protein
MFSLAQPQSVVIVLPLLNLSDSGTYALPIKHSLGILSLFTLLLAFLGRDRHRISLPAMLTTILFFVATTNAIH